MKNNLTVGFVCRLAGYMALSCSLVSHCGADLVGHWTFEGGNPLADSAGNFGDLVLQGNATITGDALDVNGSGITASGWASTSGSGGVAIGEKTLVSWITLESLGAVAQAGSALTLDSTTFDQFDGIVFGEREVNRWMNGSNGFTRTPEFEFAGANAVATTVGGPIQLAISYADLGGGNVQITGYLDGVSMGSYASPNFASWAAGDQEAIFGIRHIGGSTPGALDALIHEARIYDTALTESEIQALTITANLDSDNDDLPDAWEEMEADNLAELDGKALGPGPGAGSGDFDNDGLLDIDEYLRLTKPKNPDTDGDDLNDGDEVAGAGDRPPTSPKNADTDGDGLTDLVETNDLTFNGPTDTGTDPTVADSDNDGFSDGVEVNQLGSDPLDPTKPAFSQSLVGHWTFEPGVELVDLTGNFPDIILEGAASVANGQLDINGTGTTASDWAHSGVGGIAIASKTLVSWMTLEGLDTVAIAGSAMSLDSAVSDSFDGIAFAERQTNRWMNGSTGFTRSPEFQFDQTAVSVETTTGTPIMLAITYQDLGAGQVEITGYRDGVSMGTYTAPLATWTAGEQEVLFGPRHTNPDPRGALDASIEEARLYASAATASQIMDLFLAGPTGGEVLAITDIFYNFPGDTVDLTWVSKPGVLYRVEFSDDLILWRERVDFYPTGGATDIRTSYPFQGIPSDIAERFFRVLEQ